MKGLYIILGKINLWYVVLKFFKMLYLVEYIDKVR